MEDVRPSPIAGTWYLGDPAALASYVDEALASASPPVEFSRVVAIVVPHAGHRYSGAVAAHAFRCVMGDEPAVVAVVSPFHQYHPVGVLTSGHTAYRTPLGDIAVDASLIESLERALDSVGIDMERVRYDQEHALEIELPFLQRCLAGPFRLLPLMLRDQSASTTEALGHALADVLADEGALVVASSDLSHFYPAPVAERFDAELLSRLRLFDPVGVVHAEEEQKGFACGRGAIATALWAARDLGASHVEVLQYAHSGHVTGDNSAVVGYGAAVVYA